MFERYQPDLEAYLWRARSGPCFVCAVASRDPDIPEHHIFYEDDAVIAFLNRCPTQYGYTLEDSRGRDCLPRRVHRTQDGGSQEMDSGD